MRGLNSRHFIAAVLLLAGACLAAGAQELVLANGTKTIHVRKIQAHIKVDGKFDEPVWATIPPITDFVQKAPDLGQPVSERTEARIFYDDRAIYFAFKCFDREPKKIIHRYGAHDGRTNSDSINIILDTFHDRRTGFFYSINSRGIQFDALLSDSGSNGEPELDPSWDGIWYSAASVEDWGWTVEVEIPFKSIRISNADHQVWGLNMEREIVRKNETAAWQPVPRYDNFMRPSKAGEMTGIDNVHVGRNLELIPYFTTRYRQSPWAPQLQGEHVNAGLDARYGLTQNLTLSLAINPDFGETEADEFTSEISRFEIFFPEKRKFFTEGANYFTTPLFLFFSRRIGARLPDGEPQRILEGGKLTGKTGRWTLGALEALTQRTSYVDPATGLRQSAPGAFFGVFRVQRDLFTKSSIGLISVNRVQQEAAPGLNIGQTETAQGLDLNILSGQHLRWESQFMANTNFANPGLDGQHLGWQSTASYDSELWSFGASGKFLGRKVDLSSIGFEPEPDRWAGQMFGEWKPFINRYGIRQVFFELNYDEGNNTRGWLEESGADAEFRVQFKNFWTLEQLYSFNRARFWDMPNIAPPQPIPADPTEQNTPSRVYETPLYRVTLSTSDASRVSANFSFKTQKAVEYNEFFYGFAQTYSLGLIARVTEHLRQELNAVNVHESLRDHTFYQDRTFLVSRTLYQFTPKLRARVLAQWAEDKHGHDFSVNSLFAYDFTARSALFVGYNRQRHAPLDPADLGNEFFVKLSYLFSF